MSVFLPANPHLTLNHQAHTFVLNGWLFQLNSKTFKTDLGFFVFFLEFDLCRFCDFEAFLYQILSITFIFLS